MSLIKDKLVSIIKLMEQQEAEELFNYIKSNYKLTHKNTLWEGIEEIDPDDIDKYMLKEINTNADCQKFITQENLLQ